ncbi:MAG TPA: serine protease [Gemmataceae bacterium]|jgi:S1-C subfamily serine protease|nr:serine protease [Gemmataceae bacterium]
MRSPIIIACIFMAIGPSKRLWADDQTDTVALFRKSVDSVAFITASVKGGVAMASGTLIDRTKRYVLTNYHALDDADKIHVQFPLHQKDETIVTDKKKYVDRVSTGEAIRGTLVYRDESRDLAIIQVDRLPDTAKEMPLAKGSPALRESTFSIGSPGAVNQLFSFTDSSVRAVGNEDLRIGGNDEILRIPCRMVIATNAMAPGDSGGPLINKQGELVAVSETGGVSASWMPVFIDVTEVRGFLADMDDWLKDPGKIVQKKVIDSVLFMIVPDKDRPHAASGALVNVENRYVLTANHVLGAADEVRAQFPTHAKDGSIETAGKLYLDAAAAGQAIRGNVVHRDPKRDLAIVQLEKLPPTARPIRLAKASPEVGEAEWTFGSMAVRVFGITEGKVRAVGNEELVVQGGEKDIRIKCKTVTVTNALGPRDSGGPVVNRFGELIAISEIALNQCVDVTEVRATLADLKKRLAEPKAKGK